jgi:hypothetical protein
MIATWTQHADRSRENGGAGQVARGFGFLAPDSRLRATDQSMVVKHRNSF